MQDSDARQDGFAASDRHPTTSHLHVRRSVSAIPCLIVISFEVGLVLALALLLNEQPSPEPSASVVSPLSLDVGTAQPASGGEPVVVIVMLTNRSPTDPLTNVSVNVGGATAVTVADLAPGQSRAEQFSLYNDRASPFVVVSYVWKGRTDSIGKAVASIAAPNPLLAPFLAGVFGVLAALGGQAATHYFTRQRTVDDTRRAWYDANVGHFSTFLNVWNGGIDLGLLNTAYGALRGHVIPPRSVRQAYEAAARAFDDQNNSTPDQRQAASEALTQAIERVLARQGPPLES